MMVTQRALKCISTLLAESGSYANPRQEQNKVPLQNKKHTSHQP